MAAIDDAAVNALIREIDVQKDRAAFNFEMYLSLWRRYNELRRKLADLGYPEEPFDDGG